MDVPMDDAEQGDSSQNAGLEYYGDLKTHLGGTACPVPNFLVEMPSLAEWSVSESAYVCSDCGTTPRHWHAQCSTPWHIVPKFESAKKKVLTPEFDQ